jgi:hypothetical protein
MLPILVTKTKDAQKFKNISFASKALNIAKGAMSQPLINNRLKKNIYNKKHII